MGAWLGNLRFGMSWDSLPPMPRRRCPHGWNQKADVLWLWPRRGNHAAELGRVEHVKMLLKLRAEPTAKTRKGSTPLMMANFGIKEGLEGVAKVAEILKVLDA